MATLQEQIDIRINRLEEKQDALIKALEPLFPQDSHEDSIEDAKLNELISISLRNEKDIREIQGLIKSVIKNNLTTEEPIEDEKFTKQTYAKVTAMIFICSILSVLSFKYMTPAFPIAFALAVAFIGYGFLLFSDAIGFVGYSIGRVAKNAVAMGLTYIAFSIFFSIGVWVGNTYISNPNGGDNETGQRVIIEQVQPKPDTESGQQQPSSTRGADVVLPSRTGEGDTER